MFFFFAILSMFGYAIHETLLAKYSRSIESFSLSFYRSASLVITMSPLLLLADTGSFFRISEVWHFLFPACALGAIANPFFKGSAHSLDWIFRDAQKISLPGPPGLD